MKWIELLTGNLFGIVSHYSAIVTICVFPLTSIVRRSYNDPLSPNYSEETQIARFAWPTWGPHGSCWPQVGPMLAPWTLLSRTYHSSAARAWYKLSIVSCSQSDFRLNLVVRYCVVYLVMVCRAETKPDCNLTTYLRDFENFCSPFSGTIHRIRKHFIALSKITLSV